jgi:hypothetical protein
MLKKACWTASMFILMFACNRSGPPSAGNDFISDPEYDADAQQAIGVIYSMQLPTDIIEIFEKTGTGFNPDFTIPLKRISLYDYPGQMALLIGALGVDLSYCKLFERKEEAGEYYKNIELLANNLDLPREIFEKSSDELQWYLNNPDSITGLIDQIFTEVDNYFRDQNQESLAYLTLMGGWLETMYIGVRIYQDKSVLEMGERILQQKYALNSLSGLLANYQESLVIRKYMHPMNQLKEIFREVEIKYSKEGFKLDQQNKMFHSNSVEITYGHETLDEICSLILNMREQIINY